MRQYYFVAIVLLASYCSNSQSIIIQGTLTSENNGFVSGASVTISDSIQGKILAYSISDRKGNYYLKTKLTSKNLKIKINFLGYKTIVEPIDNKSQTKNFTLIEEATVLKEVVLKNSPITRRGDTINYSVNSFSKQEDRTIADVLKNMPGIEVLTDGKILYQGKPINKYYIEGLDLLEGKYNLANSNLPYKEVARVQVLENHQPIKILDSLVFSEQAAINIKLKNKYTFTGQAELGSGLSPLLWDANITPMLFTKKKQMLSSYQANNIGDNVGLQLKTLTIEDLLDQFESNTEKQDWLAIQQLSVPNFSEKRWLDNTIHLVSTNYLHKLKNDYELRLNISYLNDYQQQNGSTNTQYFTANDTIALQETKYNQLYTNTLETNLTLQKNTGSNFFKNSLQFQGFWDQQRGTIALNDASVLQNLSNRYFKLSNNLKTLFPLGKQIITLKSYVGLNKTPQSLIVNPGQFNDLLNNGEAYQDVLQDIDLQTFYTNNSLGFTKGWKHYSFSPKFAVQFEKQKLESNITTATDLNTNFRNNLDWLRSKISFDLKTQYKKDKWRLDLTTPLNLHNYNLEDEALQKSQDLNRLTFEPRLSINYEINSFWRIRSSGNLSNQFGSINQVYYAYILQNYRNIQRIDAPLPELQTIGYSTSIMYRNPIKSLFFNLSYTNSTTENNLLYDNQVLENGSTELQAIAQNNKRYRHNFAARSSKFFDDFNTNLTLSVNYSLQDFVQILNTELTDISNQNWRLNAKIDTDLTDWLNTELESTWQFSNNEIQNQKNQTITQQFHKFNINLYPNEHQYVALKSEYVKNSLFSETTQNLFTDLIYRYTWKKKNIDFELQWTNIFNTENYRTININDFSYIETNFNLRPSQVLFRVQFSL